MMSFTENEYLTILAALEKQGDIALQKGNMKNARLNLDIAARICDHINLTVTARALRACVA